MVKRYTKHIVTAVAVMALCVGTYAGVQHVRTSDELAAASQASAAEQSVFDAQSHITENENKAISQVTGIDFARVSTDSAKLEKIVRAALTWDDYKSYTASRERVIGAGASTDSQFLTEFMPEAVVYETSRGEQRNTIDDAQAVTKFASAKTYCTSFDGDQYRYMCVAEATSTSSGSEANATYVVSAVMNSDTIVDISAIQVER